MGAGQVNPRDRADVVSETALPMESSTGAVVLAIFDLGNVLFEVDFD